MNVVRSPLERGKATSQGLQRQGNHGQDTRQSEKIHKANGASFLKQTR